MRLLLVEDVKWIAATLKKELGRNGFAVDCADKGVDAEFIGNEEPYDIVFLTLDYPSEQDLRYYRTGVKTVTNSPSLCSQGAMLGMSASMGLKREQMII